MVAAPVFHEGISRVYTTGYSSYLETLGDVCIRMGLNGLQYICHVSKPYNKSKHSHCYNRLFPNKIEDGYCIDREIKNVIPWCHYNNTESFATC